MLTAMRVLILAECLLLIAFPAYSLPVPVEHHAQISSASAQEIPPQRADDSYAIYSLLTPGPLLLRQSGGGARWAIAAETVNFSDMNPRIDPRGALKAPPGGGKQFHEAVESFLAAKYERYRLQPKLHLDHAYELLSPGQVRELRAAKSSVVPDSRARSRYAAYVGVTLFSGVYFDAHRDTALVYRNDWCGTLCGQAQWIYLKKQNGHWKQISGITRPGA
jgi:drug/metabolite transporter superfamily protein YnfA